MLLNILDLGYADYQSTWDLQKRIVDEVVQGQSPETLILVEHPHVITRGIKCRRKPKPSTDMSVFDIERGGEETYHGPGQLVGYPIIHLTRRGLKITDYIRTLEGILIETLFQFGIEGKRVKGFTGVWAGDKKIASIGVAVRRWVTYHGFALNVNTDLNYFKTINPCGLEPEVMTSMESILGHPVSMEEIKKALIQAFEKKLGALSSETVSSSQGEARV